MSRAWAITALLLAFLVQGCCHYRCCKRRPLYRPCYSRCVTATPSVCCHGGETYGVPVIPAPPVTPYPPLAPLPPGPPPQ